MKGQHTSWTNQRRNQPQHADGIRKKHQNESAYRCIEELVRDKVLDVRFDESYIAQSSFSHPYSRPGNGFRIAFDPNYLA